ncbi:MAG: ATP-NAD kinase family protein [Gaiellaceae bacterium MAG52_C11]|nr:ATP-NAD kinase family protein [Candidatus Gaiellasilicea maunaloa]
MTRIGLIVNPIAGMGGRVGLKGTDGIVERARELGATPVAAERTARALVRLERDLVSQKHKVGFELIAAAREMGGDLALGREFAVDVLPGRNGATSAADTRAASRELARREVDLILFAGGDGTGSDIHEIVGDRLPILGIPTGVKMHSAVFATSPENAGEVAAAFVLAGASARLREAEVVDVDEEAAREGRIETRLYGAARVPEDRLRMQSAKARSAPTDEAALDAVCRSLAVGMDPRRIYVLGPGTTTRRVLEHLGLPKTLLGIDAVRAGSLVGSDLGERELLALLEGQAATLVLGVVGGQGALLGRGNQQLSPAVLRRIGLENVEVIAGLGKLAVLDPPWLRVDTGDLQLDAELAGYRRVHVAPRREVIFRVAA